MKSLLNIRCTDNEMSAIVVRREGTTDSILTIEGRVILDCRIVSVLSMAGCRFNVVSSDMVMQNWVKVEIQTADLKILIGRLLALGWTIETGIDRVIRSLVVLGDCDESLLAYQDSDH